MLEGATAVEVIEEVAFVRLVPTQLICRDWSKVESIDVRRLNQPSYQFRILGDGCNDQAWSERGGQLILCNANNAGEWK